MMKKQYTEQEINLFFTRFKQLPEYFEIEKVHQLINNPNAKAVHKVNFKYKPFKLMIMTSMFILGLASFMFWSTTSKTIEKSDLQLLESKKTVIHTHQIDSNENKLTDIKVNNVKMPVKGIEIINSPLESIEIIIDSNKIERISMIDSDLVLEVENIVNNEIEDSIIDSIQFIELNINQYIKLGFDIQPDKIQIKTKGWNVFLSKKSTGVQSIKSKEKEIKLIFLANRSGYQMIKWAIFGDDKDKFENEYFKSKIQNLIPIVMKQSAFPNILTEDQVFWFEPSEELFNALPEHIGKQLRMEYNFISAETDEQRKELTTNCTYFEACKSTLKVENCKLYPNPTSANATLEFSLTEPVTGTISLVNISGAQLRILTPTFSFPKGNNSFKFDLSGISPGIYLVLIKTDKGFKTQRLIISR